MSRALQKPLPRRVTRMEAAAGEKPFDDPDWLFEPAFPGRRVLARVEDTRVSLQAGAEDLAARLPAIAKALAAVRARTALLDGIVVALDCARPALRGSAGPGAGAGRGAGAVAATSSTCCTPRTGTCGACPCGSARPPCAACSRIPDGCC